MALGNIMSVYFTEMQPMSQPVAVKRQQQGHPARETVQEQWSIRKATPLDASRQVNSLDKGKIIDIVM